LLLGLWKKEYCYFLYIKQLFTVFIVVDNLVGRQGQKVDKNTNIQ